MSRHMKCSETGKDIHFTIEAADRAAEYSSVERGRSIRVYRCPPAIGGT